MADTQTGVGVVDLPPNVINLADIKRLQLNSLEDVINATKLLSRVVAEKKEELLFEKQSVTLKLTSGVFSPQTTNKWWEQEVVDNPNNFLLTTDFTNFIAQIDLWLVQHAEDIQKKYSVRIIPEQFPVVNKSDDIFKQLDLTINSNQVDLNLLDKIENIAKIRDAFRQTDLIVSSLVIKPVEEKELGVEEIVQEEDKKPVAPEAKAVTTAGVKPPADDGGGAEAVSSDQAQVLEDQAQEAERLKKSFAGDSIESQALRRATNHEFSWIYNHVLFDLMGRHGIMPDPALTNQLAILVKNHLTTDLTPDQIRNLFANPALRLAEVRKIYEKLASQPEFVQKLRGQYMAHLDSSTEQQKIAFLESTGFDALDDAKAILKKRKDQLESNTSQIEAFKQSPVKQAENSLATITGITVDGANAVNFERAVVAVTQAMGSKDIARDLGLQYPENKADLTTFVKKLSAEQLVLIFFANPNNPNAIEGSTLTAVSQNIEKIKALLTTALLATSIDKVVDSATELKKLLGVLESTEANPSDAEVESLVTSVQTLTGTMPVGNKRDEVSEALTTDERKSHTQELMDQYQKRVQKIWLQLDEETQLQAYYKLYNMVPNEANRAVLLDKVEHLRDVETGSLPWNPNLFNLIKWEDFLRHSAKQQSERKAGEKKVDFEKLTQELKLTPEEIASSKNATVDKLRETSAGGFIKNLSGQQVEQLQFSHLITELEKGIAYAQGVSDKIVKEEDVSDLEYRSALGVLERVDTRLILLKKQAPLGDDKSFDQSLQDKILELSDQHHFVLQTLLAYQPRLNKRVGATEDESSIVAPNTEGRFPQYKRLSLVETYQVSVEYQAPEILLPSYVILQQAALNPEAEMADGVSAETLLADPNSLSLASLNQAATKQNNLTGNNKHKIAAGQQSNQALADAKALVGDIGQIASQSKGNWVAAAGLGIKKYFTDKEFRQRINRVLMKIAQIGMAGFIAGTALVGLLLQKLIGTVGAWGGAAAGAAAGAGFGFLIGGPIGAVIGGVGGGIAGYLAGGKLAALNAASGAELLSPGLTSPIGFEGAGSVLLSSTAGAGATVGTPLTTSYGSSGGSASATVGSSQAASQSAFQSQALNSTAPSTTGVTSAAQAAQTSQLGASGTAAAGEAAATSGATAAAAAQAPFLGSLAGLPILALIPGGSMFILAMITVYTLFVIFSAFLIPLPVGNLSGTNSTQSEYATLTKRAAPTEIADGSTATVIYKVTLQSRRNYRLKVTAVTDTANTGFTFQSSRPTHVDPQVAPPATLLNPRISLADFSPDFDNQTQEKEYSVIFNGGKQVLVSNTVTVTYDVQDAQGNVVATGETLSATANVNIGDHGVACWPASGEIWQLPGGSFSHRPSNGLVLDAYDIGAVQGTNIYTPFDGWAHTGDFPPRRSYGKFVVVDSFVRGHWIRLIYGHFMSTTITNRASDAFTNVGINHDGDGGANDGSNNVGQRVTAGQLLGKMDDTGYSFGSHLHYELIFIDGVRHSLDPSDPLTLEDLVPRPSSGQVREGDNVRTCYN